MRDVPDRPASAPDPAAVSAVFLARAASASPAERGLAEALIGRLQPTRWTLEWSLPWWLGESLGVDPGITRDLVLANVLGLGALRLEDDLVDGEVPAAGEDAARRLSAALFDEAIAIYREHFGVRSPIWRVLRRSMLQWRAATSALAPQSAARAPGRTCRRSPTRAALARRGAPVHVSASAMCLLAGREDLLPRLRAAIDGALAAWVLFDDAKDWQADVRAGRPNAFVTALVGDRLPIESSGDLHDEAVIALLAGDGVGRYFERIRREADRSAAMADELGLTAFAAHVRGFGARSAERGPEMQAHYHAIRERATVALFGEARG